MIDAHSSVPIFVQIADHTRRAVAAGMYRAGEPIPSLRALAVALVVNPNTVQRAYDQLEREGLIEARKGLGMFVTADGAADARAIRGRRVRRVPPGNPHGQVCERCVRANPRGP